MSANPNHPAPGRRPRKPRAPVVHIEQHPRFRAAEPPDLPTFLAAVFGAAPQESRTLIVGDERFAGDTPEQIAEVVAYATEKGEPVYMSPQVARGAWLAFLVAFTENATADSWQDDNLAPTTVLYWREARVLCTLYSLDKAAPVEDADRLLLAMNAGGRECEAPTLAASAWELLHFDPETYTTFEAVQDIYGAGEAQPAGAATTQAPAAASLKAPASSGDPRRLRSKFGKCFDADVIGRPFDLTEEAWQREIPVTWGTQSREERWMEQASTDAIMYAVLCQPKEGAKDGDCFIAAKMTPAAKAFPNKQIRKGKPVGPRRSNEVESIPWAFLDFDHVQDKEAFLDRAVDTGLAFAIYETHSDGETITPVKRDALFLWMRQNGFGEGNVTLEIVQAWLRTGQKQPESVWGSATYREEHVGAGISVIIDHPPFSKLRAAVPLREFFSPGLVARTHKDGQAEWKRRLKALARMLGEQADPAAMDVARVFYPPRHPAARSGRCWVMGGEKLDWRGLDLSTVDDAGAAATVKRKVGPATPRWGATKGPGWQVVDVFQADCPERIRARNGYKITVECPLDHEHGTAVGDPNDMGCYIVNAGDGDGGGFTFSCSHSHKPDRLVLVNAAVEAGWFPASRLTDPQFNALLDSESAGDEDEDIEMVLAEYAATLKPAPERPEAKRPADGAVALFKVPSGMISVEPAGEDLSDFDWDRRNWDDEQEAIGHFGRIVAVVQQGSDTRYAVRTKSGEVLYMIKQALLGRFESCRVKYDIEITDAKGKTKIKAVDKEAIKELLKSDAIRIYDKLDIDPTARMLSDSVMNTWEGVATKPVAGDCDPIESHVLNCLTAGVQKDAESVWDYYSQMVQEPLKKPGFALAMIGDPGAGKTTLPMLINDIIGEKHSIKVSRAKHALGSFNKHSAGMLHVFIDEASLGKRGADDAGVLRDMITSPKQITEPKGIDSYQERSIARYTVVNNPGQQTIPAQKGERRWFVLKPVNLFPDADDDPKVEAAQKTYFDRIYKWADNGGREALFHKLLTRDISKFNRFKAPKTAALAEQRAMGMGPEEEWLAAVLEDGLFTDRDGASFGAFWELGKPIEIEVADLRQSFFSHVRKWDGAGGPNAFTRVLRVCGEVRRDRRGGGDRDYYYTLGPRREWQARFTKEFGHKFAEDVDAVSPAVAAHPAEED